MLEIFVQRPKEDVESAIVQFVARRSYRLSKPWYIDGLRIEAPSDSPELKPGFWATMLDSPVVPRIDVETKRRRSGTRVRVNIANTPESTRLASELHSFLLDARSYDRRIPTLCPRCSSPVNNVTARFCGRCGFHLTGDMQEPVPRSMIPPLAQVATRPTVTIERDTAEPPSAAPIRSTPSHADDQMEQSFEWPSNRSEESATLKSVDETTSADDAASDAEQERQPSPMLSESLSDTDKKTGRHAEPGESKVEATADHDELGERDDHAVNEAEPEADIVPEAKSEESTASDEEPDTPDQTNMHHRRALAEE